MAEQMGMYRLSNSRLCTIGLYDLLDPSRSKGATAALFRRGTDFWSRRREQPDCTRHEIGIAPNQHGATNQRHARRGSTCTNFRKALTDFSNMVILVREPSEFGPVGDTARRSVAPESTTLKSRRKKEGMVEAPDSLSRPETRSALAARALKPRDQ
jgi:hypothetical protein